ncbi:MAG: flavin reductase family protein [Pontibacterium sp.]
MNSPISDQLKQALRGTAETVHIIALRNNVDDFYAMTATAVTVVSLEPASFLVCINKSSDFYKQIAHAQHFSINTLKTQHQALSNACAGGASHAEREILGAWTRNETAPLLEGSQASYLCEVSKCVDHGSHLIVIGNVQQVRTTDLGSPLLYLNGSYTEAKTPNITG